MKIDCDVIVDLQAGDCGKGKIANALAPEYDGVLRYNGGPNAGHTIYIEDRKVVTHQVPCGVFHEKTSIIGPECVVNVEELEAEIRMIEDLGFPEVRKHLYVDYRAHRITKAHLRKDKSDSVIGTTKKGIGPAYADKSNRTGQRVGDIPESDRTFQVGDVYDMFFGSTPKKYFPFMSWDKSRLRLLAEGAQGYQLDINFGRYPYVTSSHCVAGAVCLNGLAPKNINKVYGVMKAYQTYVGNDASWGKSKDTALKDIQWVGKEFGATTGRERKTDWLDLDAIIPACKINGVSRIYINKMDVLEQVGKFAVYAQGLNHFSTSENFVNFVEAYIHERHWDTEIIWSRSPTGL